MKISWIQRIDQRIDAGFWDIAVIDGLIQKLAMAL
jgi:hypothetical protein